MVADLASEAWLIESHRNSKPQKADLATIWRIITDINALKEEPKRIVQALYKICGESME
ncbi:hypothetical protein HK102_013247, partial [Quaeritorhiza haematococci]